LISHEYLAGFFDGEGCITLGSNGGLTVSIVNTSLPVLWKFEESFLGTISERKQKVNKKQYQWRAYGENAKEFLECMLPHLIDKKDQVTTALHWLVAKEQFPPLHRDGRKGKFANPERLELLEMYRTTLTEQKLGKHIVQ
jgi:hypothetical protein